MSFDTLIFFFLFIIVFTVLRIFPRVSGYFLLFASVIFYSVAGWIDMLVVASIVVINYYFSFKVSNGHKWLASIVLINLSVLIFFKYRSFLLSSVTLSDVGFYQQEILIPLGISFYVFQAVAYQVDIVNERVKPLTYFPQFALFILFFPQMIAGPISRVKHLGPQVSRSFLKIKPKRNQLLIFGLVLCLLGLFKKVVLADSISPFVDAVFQVGPADIFSAWVGAILFSFQIYFDFSGYSDIALGSAYLLGFRLPLNFRQPYLSLNPQDFWVRWHITLSTWIRDYLYIPLGGSRKGGNTRQLLILMVTMMLAGLWHGANWTFIFWGALWGLYIALWRWFGPIKHMLGKLTWLPHIIIVVVLWVVFRSDSITSASEFLKGMIGMHYGAYSFSTNTRDSVLIVIGLMSLFGLHCLEGKFSGSRWIMRFRKFNKPLIYGLAVGLIFWLILLPKSGNPFIYFRF